eukprot:gi/632986520/ref/XP_007910285.1/ PREDICTED: zonadhesin-like [Callorhinchus milii]
MRSLKYYKSEIIITVALCVIGLSSGARPRKPPDRNSHGKVNVSELSSTNSDILTFCDFNDNSKPLCEWSQATNDQGDWKRISGSTPTEITGPEGDYPDGTGYYIYQEADDFTDGQAAKLNSPSVTVSGDVCVQFRYFMYGIDSTNALNVYVETSTIEKKWSSKGIQSNVWLLGTIDLNYMTSTSIKVIFESVRGATNSADSALDNILIRRGTCSGCIHSCGFDEMDNLCGWTNEGLVWWEQWSGETETDGTGPDDDHSKPGLGKYLLLDSAWTNPGDISLLKSTTFTSSECLTLSFYYYMFGTATQMKLNVYAQKQAQPKDGNSSTTLWSPAA